MKRLPEHQYRQAQSSPQGTSSLQDRTTHPAIRDLALGAGLLRFPIRRRNLLLGNVAMKYHPDKNPGMEEKFKEVTIAHETLSDPEKRQFYDEHGKNGPNQQDMSEEDILSAMFGIPGRRRRGGKAQGKDTAVVFPVTLEDLYNGKVSTYKLDRTICCPDCQGKGTKNLAARVKCQACHGQGVRVQLRQMGFGFIQQVQAACDECGGDGEFIEDKDRCATCEGEKTLEEEKVLDVYVDKGMEHGQKLTFSGEADQLPGTTPGDVILVLKMEEHATFKRVRTDLFFSQKIKLVEALCGFSLHIKHLDGRTLVVNSKPGEIIKPGDTKVIANEGMPQYKNPFEKGRLFVQFEIEFPEPKDLTPDVTKALIQALPKVEAKVAPAEAE